METHTQALNCLTLTLGAQRLDPESNRVPDFSTIYSMDGAITKTIRAEARPSTSYDGMASDRTYRMVRVGCAPATRDGPPSNRYVC